MSSPDTPVVRRLAAVLAADVVGYSRLMGQDELGTLSRLKGHRRELVDGAVAAHQGRIVKTTGDGMLIEFPSVTDALLCAAHIQRGMPARNADLPEERRIAFRVGINIGDLIIENDDIFGNGVNVAARLESIAPPGGICISGAVYEEVRDRIALSYEDAGEIVLKNIARPVRVYRVGLVDAVPPKAEPEGNRLPVAVPLPDKPSLAVLPFQNMSGEAESEYFADGMVEDVITALSRIDWLFVIARNSTFTYKGRAVDIKQVGRELGVRYVLEGSVRKAAGRVRISAQLIDAADGAHIWADRFDGNLDDVFELQDRIAESVAGAIEPKLRLAEIARSRRKPTDRMDAYDCFLQALANFHLMQREPNREAVRLLERAIAIDPNYTAAHALAALCYAFRKGQAWMDDRAAESAEGLRMARIALAAGYDDATTLYMGSLALAYLGGENETAAGLIDRALKLNPNLGAAWNLSGWIRVYLGDAATAIEHFGRAARLSPLDPIGYIFSTGSAFAHFVAERYEDTVRLADKALHEGPVFLPALRIKVAALGMLGRGEDARQEVERLLRLEPQLRLSTLHLAIPWAPALLARYAQGLRAAGVAE